MFEDQHRKWLRRPDVNRTARELDETFWRGKNPVLLTDIRDTSVIRNIPAPGIAPIEPAKTVSQTTTPRTAGDRRAGTFPLGDFRPCQLWLGKLAVAQGSYGNLLRPIPPGSCGGPGGWSPVSDTLRYALTKFQVPQGTLAGQQREGARNCGKRSMEK